MIAPYLYYAAGLINQKASGIPDASGFSIKNILNAVYFWAGAIAVIVIIVAGFYYVTSANNSSQIVRAKNAIFAAVIGLVIVLLAFGITNIVISGVS
jgi:hypothetical protein